MVKLINGDCLECLPAVNSGSVDMVMADLPYGEIKQGWDVAINLPALWNELLRVGKPECQYLFFASFKHGAALYNSQPKLFRYDLVWSKSVKVGFLDAKKKPLRQHELVLLFARRMGTYNPQFTQSDPVHKIRYGAAKGGNVYGAEKGGSVYDNPTGRRYPGSVQVWNHDPDRFNSNISGKSRHPTQKPQAALEWLINTYSNPGDTLLDPTMGSGSAGVAAVNLGRKFIGIEARPDYFELAKARIYGGEKPVIYGVETIKQIGLF